MQAPYLHLPLTCLLALHSCRVVFAQITLLFRNSHTESSENQVTRPTPPAQELAAAVPPAVAAAQRAGAIVEQDEPDRNHDEPDRNHAGRQPSPTAKTRKRKKVKRVSKAARQEGQRQDDGASGQEQQRCGEPRRKHKRKRKRREQEDAPKDGRAAGDGNAPLEAEQPPQQEQQQQEQQEQEGQAPEQTGSAGGVHQSPAAAAASGPDLYKFWTAEDADRLVKCVEDEEYRRHHMGTAAMGWPAVAAHFGRSVQAVRSKYRNEKIAAGGGARRSPGGGGKPRQAISYGWMAIYALSTLPDRMGTGDEVCAAVEAHPPFAPLLDRTSRPDSLGVVKWQQRIREELSHKAYFVNTGTKRKGQAIWRLDPALFDGLTATQRARLTDLPGAPFLGKHGQHN